MIDILLAVYNGEEYLKEQLDSIMGQSYQEFSVIVRDDKSTDSTVEIIKDYQKTYPGKITILNDNLGNLRSSKCFMQLLSHSESEYIMFCDQDDIWLPNKIELSLNKIKELELTESNTPLLVFSDLTVVDDNLATLHKSFWQYQKLIPEHAKDWKKLLAQNVITGCTMIMNRKAKEVSLPFELPKMIHDQWIGVNVAKHGRIAYLPIQTILYRQHGQNVAGAHQYGFKYILAKLNNLNTVLSYLKDSSCYFDNVSYVELISYKIKINIQRIMKKYSV